MDRRTKLTKTLLSNALIEMLKEQDIHKISIRELCDRADVNRSTFYKYYGSQYDLLDDIENRFAEKIIETLREKAAEKDYLEAIKNILLILHENIEMSRLLYVNKPNINLFAKIISSVDAERYVYADIHDIPEHLKPQVYDFYKTGAYRIIRTWLINEDRTNIDEVASLIVELRRRLFKSC